jgi:hypothetical protein
MTEVALGREEGADAYMLQAENSVALCADAPQPSPLEGRQGCEVAAGQEVVTMPNRRITSL